VTSCVSPASFCAMQAMYIQMYIASCCGFSLLFVHRDIHNIFGYYYHLATAEGLIHRGQDKALYGEHGDRPFVLSRAFYAGAHAAGKVAYAFIRLPLNSLASRTACVGSHIVPIPIDRAQQGLLCRCDSGTQLVPRHSEAAV
jgi:hypothetical protein